MARKSFKSPIDVKRLVIPRYRIAPDGKSIMCLTCSMTSHNLNDVLELYCGNCNVFHEDGGKVMVSARAAWEVRAGIIPGQADAKHSRRWGMTSEEWAQPDNLQILLDRQTQASSYALYLQLLCAQGLEVNWVETTFIWF